MTITRDDIRAAVGAGKISEAQANAIVALSDARRGARENLEGLDEPFELFKGFNEIFIVIGLVILYAGWSGIAGLSSVVSQEFQVSLFVFSLIGMATCMALAIYFTRIRRMVAPSIALAVMFSISASQAGMVLGAWLSGDNIGALPAAAGWTTLALLVYWAIFRVPFALLLVALSVYTFAFGLTAMTGSELSDLREAFLLSANSAFPWITLGLGLVGLVIALRFDISDPHRVTRRSAQGFWLHIISAPAIVNTLALTLFTQGGYIAYLVLIVFLIVMALFAIAIDRRSFLISGIGYMVALAATVAQGNTWLLILFLGAFLVFLGAFWERIRGGLMAALPTFPGKDRLPPWTRSKEFII